MSGSTSNIVLDESAILASNPTAGGSFSLVKTATTISLVYTPTPYSAWRLTYNLGNDSSASANADKDAYPDLMEYALGTSPTNSNSIPSIPISLNALNRLKITFTRLRAELIYTVEASSNLTDWTTIATNPGAVGETVTVTDTNIANPNRFLRLKVTL